MRIDSHSIFWVVVDPTPDSTLGDILFQTTMTGFITQIAGGLEAENNPAIHTEKGSGELDAHARLLAMRVRAAIAKGASPEALKRAAVVQILDASGRVLFDAKVG